MCLDGLTTLHSRVHRNPMSSDVEMQACVILMDARKSVSAGTSDGH